MTKEELKVKVDKQLSIINDANDEICSYVNDYIESLPYKVGDKDREYNIQSVLIKENVLYIRSSYVELVRAFNDYTFADGTPFGIKEEG